MSKQKYGFVYIWYDRKHKRYYVGCHWGSVDDQYICSSSNMKSAFKRRPFDFKRKILKSNIDNKKDLLLEEYKWLSMIKKEELGKRYYNLHNYHFNHWTLNEQTKITVGEKISRANKGDPRRSEWMKNRIVSEETKQKLREMNLGKKLSEETKMKISANHNRVYDQDFKDKMSSTAKNRSVETRNKISENNKRLQAEGKIGMRGKKHSPETIEKMKQSALKKSINRQKL